MYSNQPTARIDYLPRTGPQPFHVHFDFAPRHTLRQGVGCVLFTLFVADREYGPYPSTILTTARIWEGRKKLVVAESAQKLMASLADFQYQLEKGWASYPASGEAITGEMVLLKSDFQTSQGKGGLIYGL